MRKRRSSIFSSDTLSLTGTPRHWWRSLGLALLLIAVAELGARAVLGTGLAVPDYWDEAAGTKYEWYRAQERAPRILIIGDSTAARNFSPAAMEETLIGLDVFNLGTPGNFPLALRDTAYSMLGRRSKPDVVIVSQVAHAFYDSDYVDGREAPILGSRAARYFNNRLDPTDYVALSRVYDHRARIVARLLGKDPERPSPPDKGFMPDRRRPAPMLVPDGYVSEKNPSAERLGAVIQLARQATESNFKLIVTLPIQLDIPAQPRIARHRQWLLNQSERLGFAVLDMRTVTPLGHDDFTDTFHLSPAGAEEQSRALGELLKACLSTDDWRACLSDRRPYDIELVSDPRWYSELER